MKALSAQVAIGVALAAALFVAWNNGSNNAANAVGTAVGARVVSVRRALLLAAVSSLAGSAALGSYVTETVMRGIVRTEAMESPGEVCAGMISVLLVTGLWTLFSTFAKVPMSVHVCVVGGVLGFGLGAGAQFVSWGRVLAIAVAWILVPPVSAGLAYLIYRVFSRGFSDESLSPLAVSAASFIAAATPTFLTMAKAASPLGAALPIASALAVGAAAALGVTYIWRRRVARGGDRVLEASRILLLLTVVTMAFSFGANDVANAAGPLAAVLYSAGVPRPVELAVALSAAGLSSGILIWGSRVVETVGERITILSPPTAFAAQLGASLTMLVVSRLGIPASTSMAVVGGVMGVGMARGIRAVNLRMLARIFTLWLAAMPVTMGGAYALYRLISLIALGTAGA